MFEHDTHIKAKQTFKKLWITLDYPCVGFHSSGFDYQGGNDGRVWMLDDCKGLVSFLTDAKPQEGMNKEMSPKELINGHPFQSDSYTTPVCVTSMDLLALKQCYSNRYQNILMRWNAGWNIIATSQQTETGWDNCTAKAKWFSLHMPFKAPRFVF